MNPYAEEPIPFIDPALKRVAYTAYVSGPGARINQLLTAAAALAALWVLTGFTLMAYASLLGLAAAAVYASLPTDVYAPRRSEAAPEAAAPVPAAAPGPSPLAPLVRTAAGKDHDAAHASPSRRRGAAVSTAAGLDRLLSHGRSLLDTTLDTSAAPPRPTSGLGLTGALAPTPAGTGMHVTFRRESPARDPAAAVESEWTQLGVRDVAASTQRVREWIAKQLGEVLVEVDRCDKFFAQKQLHGFTCGYSLYEQHIPAPAAPAVPGQAPAAGFGAPAAGGFGAPAAGGFGAPAAPAAGGFGAPAGGFGAPKPAAGGFGAPAAGGFGAAPAAGGFGAAAKPAVLRKLDEVLRLKREIEVAPPSAENYQSSSVLELRLLLDCVLDVTLTFPVARDRSAAERTKQQQYVMRRLRALALGLHGAYRHNGGEPELWGPEYPTDAHIAAHVLRYHCSGLKRHIVLAHQPTMDPAGELALCCGSNGEPYFFVRHFHRHRAEVLHTQPGPDSLFHALLRLVAVVQRHHKGAYGGILGVLDLSTLGLANIL